jgi:hypothetical protein
MSGSPIFKARGQTMNSASDDSDDDLRQMAEAEVRAILSQSVPIHAATLAEAVAIAEQLKAAQNVLIAVNSLWRWFQALPASERNAIGQFKNARHFWMKAVFAHRKK